MRQGAPGAPTPNPMLKCMGAGEETSCGRFRSVLSLARSGLPQMRNLQRRQLQVMRGPLKNDDLAPFELPLGREGFLEPVFHEIQGLDLLVDLFVPGPLFRSCRLNHAEPPSLGSGSCDTTTCGVTGEWQRYQASLEKSERGRSQRSNQILREIIAQVKKTVAGNPDT